MATSVHSACANCAQPGIVPWLQIRCGHHDWQVQSEFAERAWFLQKLANPHWLLDPPAEPLRPRTSRSPRAIVRCSFSELPGRPLIIKRYRRKSLWSPLKDLWRGSQAARTVERTVELQALGFPVPTIIAAQVRSEFGWGDTWLLMDEVPASRSLYFLNLECRKSLVRRSLIRLLARLIARLHDHDFDHTDPSLTNFLASNTNPMKPEVVLIDLDGLRRCRQTPRRVAKGLRRLAMRAPVSQRERLRFLVEYARARNGLADARNLARAVGALKLEAQPGAVGGLTKAPPQP